MLKSLEVSGFKSFSKKEVFQFDSSISAIVGPNGSGKSNVVEAFKFALGEQSMKTLRGKQGGDLIFDGSKYVPRSNMARAKIALDNSSRNLNLDFDEVIVERAVHRDGINQYIINGSQVRLRDVYELLAGANIGAGSHHIISQGEADKFIKAAPAERRKNIEEALGLSVYRFRKRESEKKLEKTKENVKEIGLQRKEIAPNLDQLKKEVGKIQKAREAREKLKELYREYLKRQDCYLRYWKDKFASESREAENNIKSIDEDIKRVQREYGEEEKSPRAGQLQEEMKYLKEKTAELSYKKSELERELGRLEGQIAYLEEKAGSNTNEPLLGGCSRRRDKEKSVSISELKPKIEELNQVVGKANLLESVEGMRDSLRVIKERLRALMNFVENSETPRGSSGSAHDREEEESKSEIQDEKHQELEDLNSKLLGIKEELSSIEEREKQMNEEYNRAERGLQEAEKGKREAERRIFELQSRKKEAEYSLERIKEKENSLKSEKESFEKDMKDAGFSVGREALAYENVEIRDGNSKMLSAEEIALEDRARQEERKREIERYKMRLENAGGMGEADEIEKEYEDLKEKDEFLAQELSDLEHTAQRLRALIAELDDQLNSQFKAGVEKISREFQRLFSLLFGGGSAFLKITLPPEKFSQERQEHLSEVDHSASVAEEEGESKDAGYGGVDIAISLPRKHISGLEMLSGGERALTSTALVFAMSQVNPPPFLILDEVDAALDEANSKRFADMVEDLSSRSQLVLVTHNRETMSRAGLLYGVTMSGDGVSKLLSVKFDEAVEMIEK